MNLKIYIFFSFPWLERC